MDANVRHYNQSFLQATIVYMVNLYILKYQVFNLANYLILK